MSAPSWQDLFDMFNYSAQVARPGLIINEGDASDAYGRGVASVGTSIIGYGAGRFAATFLDGAVNDDLTDLAHDHGVDRDTGDAAVTSLTIARPTATAGAGTIPTGTRFSTTPDLTGAFQVFTNNVPVVFAAGTLSVAGVSATCTVIGGAGEVGAATVTRILDLNSLWDQTLTVTNTVAAGGLEQESDEDLRDQTRGFFLTQRRGTADAIIYGAKLTPGVSRASLEVDSGTGVITVFVSDSSGNSNAALAAAAQAVIDGPPAWRGAADIVNVVAASLFTVNVAVQLVVKAGVDTDSLVQRVQDAITNAMKRLNPGDTLYPDLITTAAKNVDSTSIVSCVLVTPVVAIVPSVNQAIRAGVVGVT